MDFRLLPLSAAIVCGFIFPVHASEIRLNGSRTVTDVVLQLHKTDIEKNSGQKILITENDSDEGVLDVETDIAQIAMTSKPLDKVIEDINKNATEAVEENTLSEHKVAQARVAFTVHKKNVVTELTLEQIKDVLTGRIKNWKELGGVDQPILVVMEKTGSPIRDLVKDQLLHDSDVKAHRREVLNVAQIPNLVSHTPNALGVMATVYMNDDLVELHTDSAITQDLYLVTKGTPSADAQAVIDATKIAARGGDNQE